MMVPAAIALGFVLGVAMVWASVEASVYLLGVSWGLINGNWNDTRT